MRSGCASRAAARGFPVMRTTSRVRCRCVAAYEVTIHASCDLSQRCVFGRDMTNVPAATAPAATSACPSLARSRCGNAWLQCPQRTSAVESLTGDDVSSTMMRAATRGFGSGLRDKRGFLLRSTERPAQRSVDAQGLDPRQRRKRRVRLRLVPERGAGDVVLARPVAPRLARFGPPAERLDRHAQGPAGSGPGPSCATDTCRSDSPARRRCAPRGGSVRCRGREAGGGVLAGPPQSKTLSLFRTSRSVPCTLVMGPRPFTQAPCRIHITSSGWGNEVIPSTVTRASARLGKTAEHPKTNGTHVAGST